MVLFSYWFHSGTFFPTEFPKCIFLFHYSENIHDLGSRYYVSTTQRAIRFKKVQAKKLMKSNISIFLREIAFLAVSNFFPVQKLIFGHFWNCNFSSNWFIWLHDFFLAWTFFNFLAHCVFTSVEFENCPVKTGLWRWKMIEY